MSLYYSLVVLCSTHFQDRRPGSNIYCISTIHAAVCEAIASVSSVIPYTNPLNEAVALSHLICDPTEEHKRRKSSEGQRTNQEVTGESEDRLPNVSLALLCSFSGFFFTFYSQGNIKSCPIYELKHMYSIL